MQYDRDQTDGAAWILGSPWQSHALQKGKLEKQYTEEIDMEDYSREEALYDLHSMIWDRPSIVQVGQRLIEPYYRDLDQGSVWTKWSLDINDSETIRRNIATRSDRSHSSPTKPLGACLTGRRSNYQIMNCLSNNRHPDL